MVRHLTTLILGGILGSMVLVGNAEACHRTKCKHAAPVVCAAPTVCVTPVCPPPAPCVKPVAYCAPKVKCCKITLPKLCLPKFCHKKTCSPAPVAYACATPFYGGSPVASPQTSPQH